MKRSARVEALEAVGQAEREAREAAQLAAHFAAMSDEELSAECARLFVPDGEEDARLAAMSLEELSAHVLALVRAQ